MPLVVPILRLSMLFLNVFETFKTMKPPLSRRRGSGSQPSVRAISQRKRDMKGCLAVWVVWCCFATYERSLESFVCLLVPFYGEIKAAVLLFLLLTRAKGAEPIYLHLIRPLIKPYASTIDSLLDLARMFGDIFFFVSSIPLRHALSWWNGSSQYNDDVQEADGPEPSIYSNPEAERQADSSAYPVIVPHLPGETQTTLVEEPLSILRGNSFDEGTEKSNSKVDLTQTPGRTRHQGLQASTAAIPPSVPSIVRSGRRSDGKSRNDESNPPLRSSLEGPKPHEPQIYRWQLNEKAILPHEIWHPPPSTYEDAADQGAQPNRSETRRSSNSRSHSSNSTLAESTPPPAEPTTNSDVDEWRLYAPFPSAYPPTPLPGPVKPLPGKSNIVGTTPRRSSDKVHFPAISEEHDESFGQSLQPPRKPLNPGSDGNLSDDKISTIGVKNHDSSSDGDSMDVDSEDDDDDEDEEDDFDITLRTPRRQRVANLPFRRSQLNTIASTSSLVSSSDSAALSTVAKGTTLRTRSSSESSSSMSLTDTDTSIAPSRKTAIPEVGASGVQNPARAKEKNYVSRSSGSADVSSQKEAASRTKQANASTSDSVNEDTLGQDKSGKPPGARKRRAVPPSEAGELSASIPPSVPAKDDAAGVRAAAANNPTTITRGRGRGRGSAPSRSSSRIANSRLPPASSSSSLSIQIDTNASAAPPRDRTIRNRK